MNIICYRRGRFYTSLTSTAVQTEVSYSNLMKIPARMKFVNRYIDHRFIIIL